MKLIICKPFESGAMNLKVQASKEERMMLMQLEGMDIEVHPAGRIITLDERASEKFAALFIGIDEVMARFRDKSEPDKPLFEGSEG